MEESKLCKEVIELGVRMNVMEKKADVIDSINTSIAKISVTLEKLEASNERHDILLVKQTETLSKLTNQIENMSTKLDDTDKNLKDLTKKVEDNISKGSISFNDIFRKAGFVGLGAVVTGVIGWILWKMGIGK